MRGPLSGYRSSEAGRPMPLGGYAVLVAAYVAGLAGLLGALGRKRLPDRGVRATDLLLLGAATHELTRTVTHDRVTSPLRSPFTEYVATLRTGEVQERSRGSGLRRAVGDLLTCSHCTAPWVAAGFVGGLAFAPRATRLFAGVFAAAAVSDLLERATKAEVARSEAELPFADEHAQALERSLFIDDLAASFHRPPDDS